MIWRDINIYLIDVTRIDDKGFNSDLILKKDAMEAQKNAVDYIYNFVFANYNEQISKEKLTYYLFGVGEREFSLKHFMELVYNKNIDNDLRLNHIRNYELGEYYLKVIDDGEIMLYRPKGFDAKKSKEFAEYVVNETLLARLKEQHRSDEYNDLKINVDSFNSDPIIKLGMQFELKRIVEKNYDISEYFDIKV